MKYKYKHTGLIVESGIKLDSALFEPIQEKECEPSSVVTDVEEKSQKKTRTVTKRKASTSQKAGENNVCNI